MERTDRTDGTSSKIDRPVVGNGWKRLKGGKRRKSRKDEIAEKTKGLRSGGCTEQDLLEYAGCT